MMGNLIFVTMLVVFALANPGLGQTAASGRGAVAKDPLVAKLTSQLAVSPGDTRVRTALGAAYERIGRVDLAIAQYRRVLAARQDDPDALYLLGHAYLTASAAFSERMKEKAAGSARVRQLLGEKWAADGRDQRAIEEYLQALAIDARLPEVHLALARLYLQGGDRAAALAEVRKELTLEPLSKAARDLQQELTGEVR